MDRRRFVKSSLLTVGGLSLPSGLEATPPRGRGPAASTPNDKFKIEYMRKEVPQFEIPPYRGASYEDTVPDTLDIAERARLGINCLTRITDPNADCEIYFFVDFHRNPPVMAHDFSDWCQNVEGMLESLPLLRIASGSDLNDNVDKVWMESLLKSIGPDGLVYYPLNGTPWARLRPAWMTPVWKVDGTTTDVSDKSVTQLTSPALWPRAMAAMVIYYLRDQNPLWKQTIERMIQRMSKLATDEGRFAFVPAGGFELNAAFASAGEQEMPSGYLAVDGGNGRLIQGLAQYYRMTGYEPAGKLAGKLTEFLRRRAYYYDDEGRFLFSRFEKHFGRDIERVYPRVDLRGVEQQALGGHFHNHTIGLLSMLEYAVTVRDQELLGWCKSSYDWAKTQGSSLVGFFPEMILPDYPSCESCEVADMIGIAAKLSAAGVGDYWDDVDRWARNQFAEGQLVDSEWIYSFAESMPKQSVAYNETAEDVAERNVGGFAGWASGNEWALRNGIMHCCTGNSTRSLYYIWENIVESKGDEFRVNLLLNRASACADVHSFIPYQGKVNLKMKRPCRRVLVRAPEWVESGSPRVVCKVSGSARELAWEGRYVNAGAAKAGETIELGFPITTRTVKETLGGLSCTLEIKGSTVVSVDPPGKNGALYERKQYRSDQVSWRKAQRFVPEEPLIW